MIKTVPCSQNCYLVGGAVRDQLLGRPIKERDWVVVGHTPQQMLAAGFQQVGRDFPVFLHPKTHEEYALARTERKQGHGHTGFICYTSPDVTVEQDLARRDLTINAMAIDHQGHLIDPYHGQQDLDHRTLQHISPAFSEDPLRVLRTARFAAQLADYQFTIASDTFALMTTMSQSGELTALAKERIWQEWTKALLSPQPTLFFKLLTECQALSNFIPDVNQLDMASLATACKLSQNIDVRFAALCHKIKYIKPILPIQKSLLALHRLVNQFLQTFINISTAKHILDLLYQIDAYRRPQRLAPFITTCQAICQAHHTTQNHSVLIQQAWQQTKHFSAKDLPEDIQGEQVRKTLYNARLEHLQQHLNL